MKGGENMNESEFKERFNKVVNQNADLFDTPEHYKRLLESYGITSDADPATIVGIISRNYAETLTYNLLKEFLVDDND